MRGRVVALAEVDERCGEKCARLSREATRIERQTLDDLVAEALLAGAPRPLPTPLPVTDDDVERYLAAHAAEFRGPAARDRAAVRFYLERERRRELERRLVAAQRERDPPEVRTSALGNDAPPDAILAEVGGRRIRRGDVEERAALPLYRLRGELARERRRHAELLLDEALWQAEARERGTSAAALRDEVARDAAVVSDAEVERYFASELRATDPEAELRPERIRPYLEFRARDAAAEAFLAAARRRHEARLRIEMPEPPRLELGPGHGGFRGGTDGGVRVILLTSYRGAASRAAWRVARDAARRPGVALAVRPLLPQWDPEATAVAAAVRCAGEQGRFWEMQDAVAEADPLPEGAALLALAGGLGLDRDAVASCLDRPEVREGILAESAEAERLGIVEPPTLLVDGRVLGRAPSPERVGAAIAEARQGS